MKKKTKPITKVLRALSDVEKVSRDPLPPTASLAELLDFRQARGKAVEALVEGLNATRPVWDKASCAFEDRPDHSTRVKAAELVLAYSDGKPVERRHVITENHESEQQLFDRSLQSPEFRRLVKEMAEEVRQQEALDNQKVAGSNPD